MTEGVGQALEQALAFWRAPALLAGARQRPLPEDVLDVVRIAAGDRGLAETAAAALGAPPDELAEAAPFYLQQLLFTPDADSYRVLGVNHDASDARIKEHYRWLVRWLHPDRNADEWEALYADRVNRAWHNLRQPEKRAAYDRSLADRGAAVAARAPGAASDPEMPRPVAFAVARGPLPGPDERLLSARTTQRLPVIVLGGFGLLAAALLALMWYAQGSRGPRAAKGPATVVAAPVVEPSVESVAASGADPAVLPVPGEEAVPPMPVPDLPEAPEAAPVAGATADVADEPSPPAVADPTPPAALAAAAPTHEPAGVTTEREARRPAVQTPAPPPAPAASRAPRTTPAAAPASPPAAEAPAPALAVAAGDAPGVGTAPMPITEPEALALLKSFTDAYAAGDLRALMRLFTRDATNNRGDRLAIAYDYQQLFDTSEARELLLHPNGWLQSGDNVTVLARFEARVQREGRWRAGRSQGDISFGLTREDGVLRIRSIRHEER